VIASFFRLSSDALGFVAEGSINRNSRIGFRRPLCASDAGWLRQLFNAGCRLMIRTTDWFPQWTGQRVGEGYLLFQGRRRLIFYAQDLVKFLWSCVCSMD
jgi:hypothetical protein